MQVDLIAYSQRVDKNADKNPMNIVEEAASVCYDSATTDTYKIAKGCKASSHLSVFEHISFTFRIIGVSRSLLAQLTRHRHASFSVRSQRYVAEDAFKYVNPFVDGTEANEEFGNMIENIQSFYNELKNDYNAENENARAILPNACCTELYMTVNARSLIEMSHLRMCNRAQKEIRQMFYEMKNEVAMVCPEVAAWMVPSCEANPKYPFCGESHGSCGRHPKLSEVYVNKQKN